MTLIEHISDTAFLVNESRARKQELSADRFARDWIPLDLRERVRSLWDDFAREVYPYDDLELALRNRFYLDRLESFLRSSEGVFVNFGAGLTSYPYLVSHRCATIEVDFPPLSRFKHLRTEQLRANGVLPMREITFLPCDLNDSSQRADLALQLNRLVSAQRTFVLAEGLIYYLTQTGLDGTIDVIREAQVPGSILALDYWTERFTRSRIFQRQCSFFCERFGFGEPEYTFVSKENVENLPGYRLLESTGMSELEQRYTSSHILKDETNLLPNPIVVHERAQAPM